VAVSGAYAYVAAGLAGLEVINVSDPSNPQRVGGCAMAGGPASAVAVSGQHAYVAVGWGGSLVVCDLSDAANPRRVGNVLCSASSLAVSGNCVYVTAPLGGLQVIEISDPANPKIVATQNAMWFGGLAVSEDKLYVAARELVVFDVGDPAQPQQLNWAAEPAIPQDLAVSAGYAYLADGEAGLQVLDIRNPARPQRVGGCDAAGSSVGVVIADGYAYVAECHSMNSRGGLQVIAVQDPSNPRPLGRCDLGQDVMDVAVSGQYAYVACETIGFQVVDISNPAEPRRIGGDSGQGTGTRLAVAVSGEHAYVAGGGLLEVLDIRNPLQPQRVGRDATSPAEDVAVSGDYACVVCSSAPEFRIIAIRDPTAPHLVSGLEIAAPAIRVTVSGDHAYVTGRQGDLYLINIRDPVRPQRLGRYRAGGVPAGLAVADNLLCLFVCGWFLVFLFFVLFLLVVVV
jgi:hypothetical protein